MASFRAQLIPESVVVIALLMFVLMIILIANKQFEFQSAQLQQQLEASTAATKMASAINKVAAAGDGAQVSFMNSAGPNVNSMFVFGGRSLRAYYAAGGYVSVPLVTNRTTTNAVGLWGEDANSTVAYDSSGLGNDGKIYGATWASGGKRGSAFYFRGSGFYDYINISDNVISGNVSGYTYAAWINFNSVGTVNWIVGRRASWNDRYLAMVNNSATGNTPQFMFHLFRTNTLCSGNNGELKLHTNMTLNPNTWYHVAGVVDGSNATIYVNGARMNSSSLTNINNFVCSGAWEIGGDRYGDGWGGYFNGIIDDVRIYNRGLSAQEIASVYRSSSLSSVPLNQQVIVKNVNGTIYVQAA